MKEITHTYPPTFLAIRDKYHSLNELKLEGFKDACSRFLRRAGQEAHAHLSSPGPGSPVRWVIFSVHDYLHPKMLELPPSYFVKDKDNEYLESLKELAQFFVEGRSCAGVNTG